MCVEIVLSGAGSVEDIVAKYNILSWQVLRNWISMYNANRELKDYNSKRGGLYGIGTQENNNR